MKFLLKDRIQSGIAHIKSTDLYLNLLLALVPCSALYSRRLNAIFVFLTIIFSLFCWFRYRPAINFSKPLIYLSLALFGLILTDYIVTGNFFTNWHFVEQKLSLLFLPMAIIILISLPSFNFRIFSKWYIYITLALTLFAFSIALVKYYLTRDINFLFYHQLAEPIYGHAVYVSMFVLVAISLLLFVKISPYQWLIILVLVLFLIFLSSKLFYLNLLIVIIYYFTINNSWQKIWILLLPILSFSILVILCNPIKDRFKELHFNPSYILETEKFGTNVYFDDISFHLLQYRNAYKILHDQRAWIFGVSKAKSQDLLVKQYRKLDMFTGDKIHPEGYLLYNLHNQFLESLVYGGILQCLLILSLTIYLLVYGISNKNHLLILFSISFILFCLVESVFETQVGLVSFLFFGCILGKAISGECNTC
jgi:hypothetical protein